MGHDVAEAGAAKTKFLAGWRIHCAVCNVCGERGRTRSHLEHGS
jgi:hypothetical protein